LARTHGLLPHRLSATPIRIQPVRCGTEPVFCQPRQEIRDGIFVPLLVIPVLTTVQHQLHTTQATVTWVLTAYLLSASVMTPILGRVGDMIGKERVFVATLIALAIGSLLAAVAPSIGVMIVARVIQGVAGGMIPVAFGIIRDEFPAGKVPGAIGALASLTAVGGGLGIVLAGPIVDALDYHWLFWLPMILTVAAAVAAVLFVPESPVRTAGQISWLPAALTRDGGHGLEEFLRALGQSFADHARYADLLLERPVSPCATERLRASVTELTARAVTAGTVGPDITAADVMALIRALRGLVQATQPPTQEPPAQDWQRFLGMHLAGMRAAHPFGPSCL
jgi:MFS family permease